MRHGGFDRQTERQIELKPHSLDGKASFCQAKSAGIMDVPWNQVPWEPGNYIPLPFSKAKNVVFLQLSHPVNIREFEPGIGDFPGYRFLIGTNVSKNPFAGNAGNTVKVNDYELSVWAQGIIDQGHCVP